MAESYKVEGKVKVVMDQQTFGSGFTKREVVVTLDGKYPQDIKIEFVQDKGALLDDIQIGQEVSIYFNLRGNEYKGQYYNSLSGWKIEAGEVKKETPPSSEVCENDDEQIPF